jgi:protein transport protein SEC24
MYHRDMIENLLSMLPTMFNENKQTETAVGGALQAGYLACKDTGGRIVLFSQSLPAVGVGKLKKRDDPSALNTPKERALYVTQDAYYTKLAQQCVQVCCVCMKHTAIQLGSRVLPAIAFC